MVRLAGFLVAQPHGRDGVIGRSLRHGDAPQFKLCCQVLDMKEARRNPDTDREPAGKLVEQRYAVKE